VVSALVNTVGEIPVVKIFIGNGADGTASHSNGHNGGILLRSGGAGFDGGKGRRATDRKHPRNGPVVI
jgi:hypothetical protein